MIFVNNNLISIILYNSIFYIIQYFPLTYIIFFSCQYKTDYYMSKYNNKNIQI